MPWNSLWPSGSKSVKANRTTGNQNTTYTETEMNIDHYWNIGANEDGHHKRVMAPKTETGGTPSDPTLDAGMDGVFYFKEKTATEAVTNQEVIGFLRNSDAIMELLGIKACGVFNAGAATPAQGDVVYSHNLALQGAGTPGIVRDAKGMYTVTFATALPSNDYLVFGGVVRNSSSTSDMGLFTLQGAQTLTNVKDTTFFKFRTTTFSGSPSTIDPLQCWFVVFGG